MNVPVGFEVEYRPRKGGKMIKHSLQLRKGRTPYWKSEEKLPKKKSSKKRKPRKTIKRRSSKKRSSRKRRTKVNGGGS
jgi:hypothetical protein